MAAGEGVGNGVGDEDGEKVGEKVGSWVVGACVVGERLGRYVG